MINRRHFMGLLGATAAVSVLPACGASEVTEEQPHIFEKPMPGHDYTIGIAQSVVSVWRKGTKGLPDVQAAEYITRPDILWVLTTTLMAIGKYGQFMVDQRPKEPLIVVDMITQPNESIAQSLRNLGHERFFKMHFYDTKLKRKSNKMGWRTSGWSRPILVDGLIHSQRSGWLTVNSPQLRDDLENERSSNIVIASALAVFASHDYDAMTKNEREPHEG